MFRDTFQHGLLTIFSSLGSAPLLIWDVHVKNGHIRKLTDPEINSTVFEIAGVNVSTCYMTCPKKNQSLGIHLPFLVMIIKNLHKYFSFEVTIIDESYCRRRFRVSNFNSSTHIHPFCTSMPIGLSGGWNQIQFNLAEFTRRAYKMQYSEAVRVQINANARVRRIYFTDRLYTEDELPPEYKLFFPLKSNTNKRLPKATTSGEITTAPGKENEKPASKESLRTQATKSDGDLVKSKSSLRKVQSNIERKVSIREAKPKESRIDDLDKASEHKDAEAKDQKTPADSGDGPKNEEVEIEIGDAELGDVLSAVSLNKTSVITSFIDNNSSRKSLLQETLEIASRENTTEKSDEGATGESEPDAFVDETEGEKITEENEHEEIVQENELQEELQRSTLTVIKEETESSTKIDKVDDRSSE